MLHYNTGDTTILFSFLRLSLYEQPAPIQHCSRGA